MPADIEQAAREMGWRPQEEFRGDPSKWVDAETFVSRGENFIPILRKNRETLREENAEIKRRLDETNAMLAASQEAIAELKKFHTEDTARQVEKARKDLVKQLREARDAGDVEGEVAIQDELAKIRSATADTPKPTDPPKPASAPAPATPDPAFTAWEAENKWFRDTPRLRGLALGIAEELRAKNASLVGKAFFDKLSEEMEPYLNPEPPGRPASKVGGGRGSPAGGAAGARQRTYADLPQEAKDACANWSRKLVGPGRAYKDEASWQAYYAQQYFTGEAA